MNYKSELFETNMVGNSMVVCVFVCLNGVQMLFYIDIRTVISNSFDSFDLFYLVRLILDAVWNKASVDAYFIAHGISNEMQAKRINIWSVFSISPMLSENKNSSQRTTKDMKKKNEKRIRLTEQQTNDKELNRANSVYKINT